MKIESFLVDSANWIAKWRIGRCLLLVSAFIGLFVLVVYAGLTVLLSGEDYRIWKELQKPL